MATNSNNFGRTYWIYELNQIINLNVFLPMRQSFFYFSGAEKFFLANRIRISACFTWTDNSDLTHVISPRTG